MKSSDFRTVFGVLVFNRETTDLRNHRSLVRWHGYVFPAMCTWCGVAPCGTSRRSSCIVKFWMGSTNSMFGKPSKKTVKVCPTIIILKWILVVDEKWWETREKNLVKVAPSGVGEGCLLGPESYEQWWEWFASINVHKTLLQHVVTSFLDGLQDECFEGFGYMFPWTHVNLQWSR